MKERYLYLTIDFFSIIFPLVFSFYPKSNFYKKWKSVVPALLLSALIFTSWDIAFTKMGIWGFNPRYVTGIYFFNLPLEEVLFFLSIPYACLFTYDSLKLIIKTKVIPERLSHFISDLLIFALLITGTVHHLKWYTEVTFISCAMFLVLLRRMNAPFLGDFYFAFILIQIPFFVVNGILTGTGIDEQVVWYNNLENLGIRLGTIPIEDIFYGMLLLLINISIYEHLQMKRASKEAL